MTFNLLHLLEDLELIDRVNALVRMASSMHPHAIGWLEDMLFRITNVDEGISLLKPHVEQGNAFLIDVLETVALQGSVIQKARFVDLLKHAG